MRDFASRLWEQRIKGWLRPLIEHEVPGSVATPLYLRGRAIGLLLAVRSPEAALAQLARHAAAALELARRYTDLFETSRRRKPTSPAAEVQQALVPPRTARVSGATIAGNVLPGYDVGGDWFDYVENPDGTWLGIADAVGNGAAAAALSAIALGAFRAARRSGADLRSAMRSVHDTMSAVGGADDSVAVTLARWHGVSSTFSWIACGTPAPMLVSATGAVRTLGAPEAAIGTSGPHEFRVEQTRLSAGERIVLASDGILERPTEDGRSFGTAGVQAALAVAPGAPAPGVVKAIENAVGPPDALEDDATLLVLAPLEPSDVSA